MILVMKRHANYALAKKDVKDNPPKDDKDKKDKDKKDKDKKGR
jgi:hypothetical protein